MDKLILLLTQLWKPAKGAQAGAVNSTEFIMAVIFAGVFFLSGGLLKDFIQGILTNLNQDGDLATNIETAIVVFVTAYLHRLEQKT